MGVEFRDRLSIDLAGRLHAILASKNLTLYEVSQKSEALYGRSSPYFLPHNLYYDLRSGKFSPSIYQFSALSRLSNYRLNDWLRALGFDVEEIVRLQVFLPSKRTVLLDSACQDPNAWIPWPENRTLGSAATPMASLSKLLQFRNYRRLGSLSDTESKDFLYAKIGREDALAFPEVFPGSIVRVNPNLSADLVPKRNGTTSSDLFLIEHSKGFYCCRLRVMGDGLIVPVSTQLPFAQVELQLPSEAKCLGIVDFEIRPFTRLEAAEVSEDMAIHWTPKPLVEAVKLGQFLRSSRIRMNLSLRDASASSRIAADLLGHEQYFVSSSSLSDYEASDFSPRHIHKAITICALYGLQFHAFLKAAGIEAKFLGKDAMPDQFVDREVIAKEVGGMVEARPVGFLRELMKACEDIPFFLRHSQEAMTGLPKISLDDWFWVGSERNPLHPYLGKALLVVVNRRIRKPVHFRSKPLWEQPLYVIMKRDGTYLCACCGLENGYLLVHPYSRELYRPIRLRNHDEAEVVGQVVTIVKKM